MMNFDRNNSNFTPPFYSGSSISFLTYEALFVEDKGEQIEN